MSITKDYINTFFNKLKSKYQHAGEFCLFTDVSNLQSIWQHQSLRCRNYIVSNNVKFHDSASQQVLNAAPNKNILNYVRLYFAPLTPFTWDVEGIKRVDNGWPECPRPVYLVFPPEILTLNGVYISDGNMSAKGTNCWKVSRESLENLPFKDIFHRGIIRPNHDQMLAYGYDRNAKKIIRRRCAEVLIPGELSISHMNRLVFRSNAEKKLAELDAYSLVHQFQADVSLDWFNAKTEKRLFLLEFNDDCSGLTSNTLEGDIFLCIQTITTSQFKIEKKVFHDKKWSNWDSINDRSIVDIKDKFPSLGRKCYYLNGYRVAEANV